METYLVCFVLGPVSIGLSWASARLTIVPVVPWEGRPAARDFPTKFHFFLCFFDV